MANHQQRSWLKYPIQSFSTLRAAHFFFQMHALAQTTRWLPFVTNKTEPIKKSDIELLTQEVRQLIESDSENIANGIYPISVLKPEPFFKHIFRVPQIFWDGIQISWRRNNKKTKNFSERAKQLAEGLPEYYLRNFHFQTDGYLSPQSADLYEHQVELLFTGTADAMRRLILRPLHQRMRGLAHYKNSFKALELGAGTGRSSRFFKLAFPQSQITVTDLSEPYLKNAQEKLQEFSGVDFMRADATATPFKDESFDIVFTVFLFHELPEEERKNVLKEARRLLKPGGFFAAVDSAQLGDNKKIDHFLVDFPKQFHEPFYTNYIKTDLAPAFQEASLELLETGRGFLSKYWLAQKI